MLTGELPHGLVRGSAEQEAATKCPAYSSAADRLVALALMLWGLRAEPPAAAAAE